MQDFICFIVHYHLIFCLQKKYFDQPRPPILATFFAYLHKAKEYDIAIWHALNTLLSLSWML